MTPRGAVLVTGVARYLGANLAARLAAEGQVSRVIGVDTVPPAAELAESLDGVELHTCHPGDSRFADLLVGERVEALAHLAIATTPDPAAGGRAAMKDSNVIGTMQVLAACQRAPLLRKLVVRSSTAAYGASFRDPAVFTEDTEPREVPRGGFARDVLDIEGYVRGFRRRRPDVMATVLRFAPFVGHQTRTKLTEYLSKPVVPTVLGRDPRLQFVHIDDVFEVLRRAVVEDHPGTYNVAGEGVLTLSQAIRRSGRIAAPLPEHGLWALSPLARRAKGIAPTLDQLDLLVHGRVVDVSRLIAEFGYRPRSTAEAFTDAFSSTGGPLPAATIRSAEQAIAERIRQARAARRRRD